MEYPNIALLQLLVEECTELSMLTIKRKTMYEFDELYDFYYHDSEDELDEIEIMCNRVEEEILMLLTAPSRSVFVILVIEIITKRVDHQSTEVEDFNLFTQQSWSGNHLLMNIVYGITTTWCYHNQSAGIGIPYSGNGFEWHILVSLTLLSNVINRLN